MVEQSSLFSNIGGSFGLFIGFSFMTVMEIGEFITVAMATLIAKRWQRGKASSPRIIKVSPAESARLSQPS